jgi:hypothetical protein
MLSLRTDLFTYFSVILGSAAAAAAAAAANMQPRKHHNTSIWFFTILFRFLHMCSGTVVG